MKTYKILSMIWNNLGERRVNSTPAQPGASLPHPPSCPQTLSPTYNTPSLYSSTPTHPTRCMIELTIFLSNCCKADKNSVLCPTVFNKIRVYITTIDRQVCTLYTIWWSSQSWVFIRCSVFLKFIMDWKNITVQWTV